MKRFDWIQVIFAFVILIAVMVTLCRCSHTYTLQKWATHGKGSAVHLEQNLQGADSCWVVDSTNEEWIILCK